MALVLLVQGPTPWSMVQQLPCPAEGAHSILRAISDRERRRSPSIADDRHLMDPALPFTNEARAGLDTAGRRWRLLAGGHDLAHELVEAFAGLAIEAAGCMLFDRVRDGAGHQPASHELWQRGALQLEPTAFELIQGQLREALPTSCAAGSMR